MSWVFLNAIMMALFSMLAFQKYLAHDMLWTEIDIFFAVFNFGMILYNLSRSHESDCVMESYEI